MNGKTKLLNVMRELDYQELADKITTCCPNAFFKYECVRCGKLACGECWEKFLTKDDGEEIKQDKLLKFINKLKSVKNEEKVVFSNTTIIKIIKYLERLYEVENE